MKQYRFLAFLFAMLLPLAVACKEKPQKKEAPVKSGTPTTATLLNSTGADTKVYVSFGSDSKIVAADWKTFCTPSAALKCGFTLPKKKSQNLPLGGKYLNATIAFGAPVGCGSTKAELNINNPKWYDILDISLVDGFNLPLVMSVKNAKGTFTFGPVMSSKGNEKLYGVFPLGCDVCVARKSPPCGQKPGKDGCKGGTQYKPDVPCQYQGPTMGGGGATILVTLLEAGSK